MSDENLHAVRRVFEAFNTGDASRAAEFIGEDYIDYEARDGEQAATGLRGPEEFRATVGWMRYAFPDLHFEEQEVFSSGDMVVVRGLMTGTQQGEFLGIPPRGRNVASKQVHIFRLDEGKVVEYHTFRDDVAIMMQLGAISLVPSEMGSARVYE